MKWSWRLGQAAGIAVYMHATFLLLLLWVAVQHYAAGDSPGGIARGLLFVLLLFGCVLLHELGHALAARRYGIRTRDITLLPIGGVARLERMPDDPKQELVVALAGPAVNVLIAATLYAWLVVRNSLEPLAQLGVVSGNLAERLLVVNVFLVVFNLLPAFPMDGGRVVRALLALKLDYLKATQIAATIGQAMALLFGFLGLTGGNPMLVFIALFVWIGAAGEAGMVELRAALGGIPVRSAMLTRFNVLAPDDPLQRAVDLVLTGSQTDFPVVSNGEVTGILTRADLMGALASGGQGAMVGTAMQRRFVLVHPADMLEAAFARLEECACRTIPVAQGSQLVGLLTADNIGEFLMVQNALRQARSAARR